MVFEQIEQPPGCGDQHVDTATQRHHLRIDGYAAKGTDDFHAARRALGIGRKSCADLRREFAGRHQDQNLQRLTGASSETAFDERQRIGGGLARASLRAGPDILPGKDSGDSGALYRCGIDIATRRGRALRGETKPECGEIHG